MSNHRMPPRIVKHCGRHMQFWFGPLLYWCPMCGLRLTMEQIEDERNLTALRVPPRQDETI